MAEIFLYKVISFFNFLANLSTTLDFKQGSRFLLYKQKGINCNLA